MALWFFLICAFIAKASCDDMKFLGNLTQDGVTTASYFISTEEVTVDEALEKCRLMFINGRLLTIFTKEEDEFIRIRLQQEGIGAKAEYIITGGRFNGVLGEWEWTHGGLPFIYSNWIGGSPPTGPGCMHVVGELSSYGWASIACTNKHKYICQF